MEIKTKVKGLEELQEICLVLNSDEKKIVFTNGCFDIIHRGHAGYLEGASALGDILIVGLNSDGSVSRLKGNDRPVIPQEDRAYLLASLAHVDYVCIFEEDTPVNLITTLKPHILVKGGDYSLDQVVGRDIVEAYGGQVKIIPVVAGKSTTDLIAKIRKL